jgi:PAS domain S-box-containing protein
VPKVRVLLLEDSPLDAELVCARLAKAGVDCEFERVESREDFVAALDRGAFDIILADYSLPSFDGLSALEIAHAHSPHVPFLFVSGGLGEEVAIESLKRGATDYVLKHRLERLAPAVTRALDEARGRADRRRMQEALREREEHHRLILESVKDYAIVTVDLGGRIAGWSSGAARVFGHDAAAIVGEPVARLFTPEDVEGGRPGAEMEEAITRGRCEDERWHIRADGERFWGSGTMRPLLDAGGRPRGFVKIVRDMTERKRAEEALREADRRKDEFLAMLAHELRNPLSAVHNAIQLAQRSAQPEHWEWSKGVIAQQVKHLTRLIDDLLDLSRITRGKIQLQRRRQDPTPVIRGALEAARPMIEAHGHALSVSLPDEPLWLDVDATRLEQVLVNLLTNAAKYTENGGRIALAARREGSDFVLSVADNGIGIGPEMLPRVFEPFIQAEQTLDRSQGGLGIGLTLARTLVNMHGGRISATSAGAGRGSQFTVRLPLSRENSPPPEGAAPARPPGSPPGVRILVVDDNVESARGLAKILTLLGHDVAIVHDGPAALDAAERHAPVIVLLDIGLPGMDGYEVTRRLRADARHAGVLLVAVSGYGQEQDLKRSAEAGFDHHLVKPVDVDALLALVEARAAQEAAAGRPAEAS